MNEKELFVVRPTNEEQNEFIITVGEHLATKKTFATRDDAEKYVEKPEWDTVFALVAEMFEINERKNMEIKKDAKEVVNSIIKEAINK